MGKAEISDVDGSVTETEEETGQNEIECYGKTPGFHICFRLPRIIFKSIITEPNANPLRQLAIATVRRFFYLTEDWKLTLLSTRYPELAGEIIIPRKVEGHLFEFDGASIPLPWLVSLLTIGILRPLGVLLIASIVHDFAFRHGHLWVRKQNGEVEKVSMTRDVTDRLFRDIITVVNGNSIVGFLGWYFVRLGYWLGVRYNGERYTGEKPRAVGLSFLVILGLLIFIMYRYSFANVAFTFLAIYASFYVLTLNRLSTLSTKVSLIVILIIFVVYFIGMKTLS
jgi:hypothetical protein